MRSINSQKACYQSESEGGHSIPNKWDLLIAKKRVFCSEIGCFWFIYCLEFFLPILGTLPHHPLLAIAVFDLFTVQHFFANSGDSAPPPASSISCFWFIYYFLKEKKLVYPLTRGYKYRKPSKNIFWRIFDGGKKSRIPSNNLFFTGKKIPNLFFTGKKIPQIFLTGKKWGKPLTKGYRLSHMVTF